MNEINPQAIKILLVDDDAALLHAAARVLEQAGFSIATAQSGPAALEAMRTNRPDMVLLDRDMPEMDGIEVCRRIRAEPAYADVLVIFFSGVYTLPKSQAAGLECGADGYIVRPIKNRELIERVTAFARQDPAVMRAARLP